MPKLLSKPQPIVLELLDAKVTLIAEKPHNLSNLLITSKVLLVSYQASTLV